MCACAVHVCSACAQSALLEGWRVGSRIVGCLLALLALLKGKWIKPEQHHLMLILNWCELPFKDSIGGFQADRHCLQMDIPGWRDFNGRIHWPTHCSHSLALLAFSRHGMLVSYGRGIPAHGQDTCKADCFVPPVLNIVQVIGGRAPFAPICHKRSTPSPLPS